MTINNYKKIIVYFGTAVPKYTINFRARKHFSINYLAASWRGIQEEKIPFDNSNRCKHRGILLIKKYPTEYSAGLYKNIFCSLVGPTETIDIGILSPSSD